MKTYQPNKCLLRNKSKDLFQYPHTDQGSRVENIFQMKPERHITLVIYYNFDVLVISTELIYCERSNNDSKLKTN